MRITRVYTKTGDDGTTGLVGGQRVPKDDPRIEAYGTIDELMAVIGTVRQELAGELGSFSSRDEALKLDALMEYIANKLFTLGADLATRLHDRHPAMKVIAAEDIAYLEKVCDAYNAALEPLKDFVLPGGSRTAAAMHVARTVARRAERVIAVLARVEEVGPHVGVYTNRLSDALFVLSRWVIARQRREEVIWRRDLPEPPLPQTR